MTQKEGRCYHLAMVTNDLASQMTFGTITALHAGTEYERTCAFARKPYGRVRRCSARLGVLACDSVTRASMLRPGSRRQWVGGQTAWQYVLNRRMEHAYTRLLVHLSC